MVKLKTMTNENLSFKFFIKCQSTNIFFTYLCYSVPGVFIGKPVMDKSQWKFMINIYFFSIDATNMFCCNSYLIRLKKIKKKPDQKIATNLYGG